MKILSIHNRYQLRGGEDESTEAEERLLESRGHEVRPLMFDNAVISGFGALCTGLSSAWSRASYRQVAGEISTWRPDIVSVHNFFPLATPAVHYAATRAGVPVIQTLHNFRTLCPNGVLFRDGSPCEKCVGKVVPWPGNGAFVFYAGRLSEEKGIPLLLSAWRAAKPQGRLLLAGDGPLAAAVQEHAASDPSVQYLGRLPLMETYAYMGRARALAFPSLMYEGMPRVIIEAFSRGTPVIATRSGSTAEMIRDRETGWLVDRGDCRAMTAALSAVFTDRSDLGHIRSVARAEFERNYTADRQYHLLMDAYRHAIETSQAGLPVAPARDRLDSAIAS